eukprot:9750821-Ditylum_brightwellii.AAC.1
MKEQNQKQEILLNALCEEKQNQCQDMFCFDCLDNLNPVEIQVNARLPKQAEKETPWEKEGCQANRIIQEQAQIINVLHDHWRETRSMQICCNTSTT